MGITLNPQTIPRNLPGERLSSWQEPWMGPVPPTPDRGPRVGQRAGEKPTRGQDRGIRRILQTMTDLMGLGISYGFIAGVIGVASRLVASGRLGAKAGRKVIHVLVGHWWFLAMALIRQPWVALIGPGSFVIINALIIRLKLLPALSGRDKNYGTVYYPLSLLVLVVLVWYGDLNAWIGALGMMIMCWGDAAAALVGEAWTARRAKQVHGPGSGGSTRAGPDRPSPTPPTPGILSSPVRPWQPTSAEYPGPPGS